MGDTEDDNPIVIRRPPVRPDPLGVTREHYDQLEAFGASPDFLRRLRKGGFRDEDVKIPFKVDFNEAHFLDHSLFECLRDGDSRADRFGGVRVHVRYSWAFKWGPKLARLTLCKLGHHAEVRRNMRVKVGEPWVRDVGCRNCGMSVRRTNEDHE